LKGDMKNLKKTASRMKGKVIRKVTGREPE